MHIYLPQGIAEEEAIQKTTMTNVRNVVHGIFSSTVRALYPEFIATKGIVQAGKFGDYSCNVAMLISQVGTGCVCVRVCVC